MTTDVVFDVHNSHGTRLSARAVKLSADLDDDRTIEKLEIERRYWELKQGGCDWGIVTEHELPEKWIANIAWALEMYSINALVAPYEGYWSDRCRLLLAALTEASPFNTIKLVLQTLEIRYGFLPGEGLTVFRHLVATKVIVFDMSKPFSNSFKIDQIQINKCRLGIWKVA